MSKIQTTRTTGSRAVPAPHRARSETYTWEITPVFARQNGAYGWRWQRANHRGVTEQQKHTVFQYYYDCVQDARQHGYVPEAPRRMR